MKEEILDRRVRKTRRQLKECLTRLLKEKKIQDITVRELAEMADINRGTFYLHYKDVFDLLEKTESELLDNFNQLVMKHDAEELKKHPYGIFVELTPNLAGLAELKEGVQPGQQASVFIKNIIPSRMKIKLIIIDTFEYQYRPSAPKYFYEGNHMDQFLYSPPCCDKSIITKF